MNQIHVPGQSRSEPNPLLVLAVALDKTNQHLTGIEAGIGMSMNYLKAIAENTVKETKHIYALAPRPGGDWGSYCLACSESAEMYVYPCEKEIDTVAPPSHIAVLPDIETL